MGKSGGEFVERRGLKGRNRKRQKKFIYIYVYVLPRTKIPVRQLHTLRRYYLISTNLQFVRLKLSRSRRPRFSKVHFPPPHRTDTQRTV